MKFGVLTIPSPPAPVPGVSVGWLSAGAFIGELWELGCKPKSGSEMD